MLTLAHLDLRYKPACRAYHANMAIINIGSTRLSYDDQGTGTPILWIHGYPLNRTMWSPQIACLSVGMRHVSPDLRGFGQSDAPDEVYTMDRYADDLVAVLDDAGIDRAIIAGLSMGGYVAMAFARKHARRMSALILADTRATPDTPEAAKGRQQSAQKALTEGVAAVVEPMLTKLLCATTQREKPEVVSRVKAMMLGTRPAGVAGALQGMAQRPDSRPGLPDSRVPTLVLVGEEDAITPPAESEEITRLISGARLERIPDAGHMPNIEQPASFNAAVATFVQGHGA